MLYFPVHVINWAKTYHRRHLSGAELTLEEKLQMAKEALGPGTWENLSDAERVELVEKQVRASRHSGALTWRSGVSPPPPLVPRVGQIWNASVREEWLETRGKHLRMVVEDDEGGKIGPEVRLRKRHRWRDSAPPDHVSSSLSLPSSQEQQQQLNRKQRRMAEKKKDK